MARGPDMVIASPITYHLLGNMLQKRSFVLCHTNIGTNIDIVVGNLGFTVNYFKGTVNYGQQHEVHTYLVYA